MWTLKFRTVSVTNVNVQCKPHLIACNVDTTGLCYFSYLLWAVKWPNSPRTAYWPFGWMTARANLFTFLILIYLHKPWWCRNGKCTVLWTAVLLYSSFLVMFQWRTERKGGGGVGMFNPPPPPLEIPKALWNRARLNPIVKTVKNCWI